MSNLMPMSSLLCQDRKEMHLLIYSVHLFHVCFYFSFLVKVCYSLLNKLDHC